MMYKKSMGLVLPAALGLMMSSAVVASTSHSYSWYAPLKTKQGSVKISLSGECSGSVTLELAGFQASGGYVADDDGNALPEYGFGINSYAVDRDFSFGSGTGSQAQGDKFTQTVNGSKRTQSLQLTTRSNLGVELYVLMSERYELALRCKDGKPFNQSAYVSAINLTSPAFSHKSTLQIAFDSAKPEAGASAMLKQQISGELYNTRSAACSNKGSLSSAKYSLTCGSPKPVRIKIAVSAKGAAYAEVQ